MDDFPLGDVDLDERVLNAAGPVLLVFEAAWSGPSQQLEPVIDEIAAEREGKIKVVKVDIDKNPLIVAKYGVRACPTIILFSGGRPLSTKVGSLPKAKLLDWLDSLSLE
ncbi:MAG: thioredoxin family protein [Pirellulales bacterium]